MHIEKHTYANGQITETEPRKSKITPPINTLTHAL